MTKKVTKRTQQLVLLTALIISLAFVPWASVMMRLAPLPDTIEAHVKEAVSHGFDGIIVYVDEVGHPPALYAAGWHDRKNKLPADPNALFKIASISKLYIAVAASRLIKNQILSLDDTLAELIPDLVGRIKNAEKITLRMMLQHRSGLPNFTDQPDYPWSNPPENNRETLALVLDMPADFEPDREYSYSNTNYLLIGEILDTTLGYSHHRYIKEEILTPLGLNNTYSLLSKVDINSVMSGYYVGYKDDIKYNDFINPGGSMVATAGDVGSFLRALNEGSLFKEGEREIYSSIYVYKHTGLVPGFQSIARYHKDLDAVVVQFVNTSGGNSWSKSENVYNRIIKILRKKQSKSQ